MIAKQKGGEVMKEEYNDEVDPFMIEVAPRSFRRPKSSPLPK